MITDPGIVFQAFWMCHKPLAVGVMLHLYHQASMVWSKHTPCNHPITARVHCLVACPPALVLSTVMLYMPPASLPSVATAVRHCFMGQLLDVSFHRCQSS